MRDTDTEFEPLFGADLELALDDDDEEDELLDEDEALEEDDSGEECLQLRAAFEVVKDSLFEAPSFNRAYLRLRKHNAANRIRSPLEYDRDFVEIVAKKLDIENLDYADSKPRANLRRISDVAPKAIAWLWPDRFARGEISQIFGDPGTGKSTITFDIAARITRGEIWPDGRGNAPTGQVLILSAENTVDTVTTPRLISAGADTRYVFAVEDSTGYDERGQEVVNAVSLDNLEMLENVLIDFQDKEDEPPVVALIIDPITAYFGSRTDTHKNADVRAALKGLQRLAVDFNLAVIVVTHPNKNSQQKGIHRVSGSQALTDAFRATWMTVRESDVSDELYFVQVKNNLAKNPGGIRYRLNERIEWGETFTEGVDVLLARANASIEKGPIQEAVDFLSFEFGDEDTVPVKETLKKATEIGISRATLYRAKARLGLEGVYAEDSKRHMWRNPEKSM